MKHLFLLTMLACQVQYSNCVDNIAIYEDSGVMESGIEACYNSAMPCYEKE